MLFVSANGGTETDTLPSDLYYQCLDGTFNGNNNQYWGEPDDGPNGQDVDLYAEVAIGRVAAETPQEVSNWLGKVAVYEADCANGSAQYVRSALFVGEHLGFGGVLDYATGMMEQIRMGSTADGYTTKGFALSINIRIRKPYDRPGYEWSGADSPSWPMPTGLPCQPPRAQQRQDYNMKLRNGEASTTCSTASRSLSIRRVASRVPSTTTASPTLHDLRRQRCLAGVWNALRLGQRQLHRRAEPALQPPFLNACRRRHSPSGRGQQARTSATPPSSTATASAGATRPTLRRPDPDHRRFDTTLELDREVTVHRRGRRPLRVPRSTAWRAERPAESGRGWSWRAGCRLPLRQDGEPPRGVPQRSREPHLLSASHGQTLYAIWTEGDKRAEAAIDDAAPDPQCPA